MHQREHPRPRWAELPADLRSRVEDLLGAPVVGAASMPGGWSPGSADRLLLADGRRAFAKAADGDTHPFTVALHRREAEVLARVTGTGAAPELLGIVDVAPWFAVLIEDVAGRHPDPLDPADTTAVLDAVAALPAADDRFGRVEDDLAHDAGGWTRLLEDGLETVDPRIHPALPALDALARSGLRSLMGDSVVQADLRADNALIDPFGSARLIDWPHGLRGARWFDAVTYLLDVRFLGGDPTPHLAHPVFDGIGADAIDGLLAVLGAYFMDNARRPPTPGVEAVRGYQRAQGEVVVEWLLERRPDLLASSR